MTTRLLATFVLLFLVLPANSKALTKVYDVEYRKSKLHYFYDGCKFTVRVNGIPSDIDILQVTSHNQEKSPEAHVLGGSNQDVKHGSGGSFAEFNMEIEKSDIPFTQQKAAELKFKAFQKSTDEEGREYYEITDSFSNFIRVKTCSETVDEVCGVLKRKCRPGDTRCKEGEDELVKTFTNECEMEKFGANIMYTGACATTDIEI